MKKLARTLILAVAFPSTVLAVNADYASSVAQWRQESERRLTAEYGTLAAVGLYWLRPGENRLGASPTNEVVLPADVAAPQVGVVTLSGKQVTLGSNGSVPVALAGKTVRKAEWAPDGSGKTPAATIGRLKLELLGRAEGQAIRVYDPNSPLRRDFSGQQWYPVDEKWVVEGRFAPFATPKKLQFDIAIGGQRSTLSPGQVSFKRDGKEYRLDVQERGQGEYVAFFFDGTTGKETYGGGRVVPITRLAGDLVSLDFNKAYNMPCAVSPYFACEIAPKQNHLSLAIPAGETKPQVKVQRIASAPDYLK